ncbi:uncharacterized protein LOC132057989 [Lycium ferocissimum]|uniref:uncharacterized protein LOC132057989 n=1 Tax=Lycium ferocissimum TaxID=112874 RepID=UPI002816440B|nr:uncharacterized protein LOC132057989 [Lycium ferocissimum]
MSEKCLLMTSLAILACHPSSTIRCFKPNPSSTNSPKREKNPSNPLENKGISKSRKRLNFKSCSNICDSPRLNVHKPLKLLDEIVEGNPSKTIVEAIFRSGWKHGVGYKIEKILKVNHSEKISENFEECKKMVTNSRSTRSSSKRQVERVFYYGATVTCSLGLDKSPRICSTKTCGACKIIGQYYGIHEKTNWFESFSTSSWSAHRKVVKQFGDGVSKKAIIVSRVIGKLRGENNGEVIILNPRAILPCFVIIYSFS